MEILPQNASRPRILIADDHQIFAETLSAYLGRTFAVVGIVGDGRSMVEKAFSLNPHLVLADVSMPILNGLDAARRVKKQAPNVKFVFLTMHQDPNLAAAAMELGRVGFVLKSAGGKELLEAIKQVLDGRSYLTPGLQASDWVESRARVRQFRKEMTRRQRDVVQLVAEGRPQKEVASILNLSIKTVEFHKSHVMRAFNIMNNAELVLFAVDRGLIIRDSSFTLNAKAPAIDGRCPKLPSLGE